MRSFKATRAARSSAFLGHTGAANDFVNDNHSAARCTGNLSVTWAQAGLRITPNMRFVGGRSLDYVGMTPSHNPWLCNWTLHGFRDASNPAAADFNQ